MVSKTYDAGQNLLNNMGLPADSCIAVDIIARERHKRFIELLGGDENSSEYTLYIRSYQKLFRKKFLKHFKIHRYEDLDWSHLHDAIEFISKFDLTYDDVRLCEIKVIQSYLSDKLTKKEAIAAEDIFGTQEEVSKNVLKFVLQNNISKYINNLPFSNK